MSFAEELGRAVLFTAFTMTIGIVFLVYGRRRRRKVKHLRQAGRKASAVVVGYDYEHDSEGNVTKYPVVRFRAPDGRLVTARPDFGGDSVHEIGDNVDVLFDPDRPEEAHLDTRASNLFTSEAVVAGWVLIVGPL